MLSFLSNSGKKFFLFIFSKIMPGARVVKGHVEIRFHWHTILQLSNVKFFTSQIWTAWKKKSFKVIPTY